MEYRETRTFEQRIRRRFQGFGGVTHDASLPDLPNSASTALVRLQSGAGVGVTRRHRFFTSQQEARKLDVETKFAIEFEARADCGGSSVRSAVMAHASACVGLKNAVFGECRFTSGQRRRSAKAARNCRWVASVETNRSGDVVTTSDEVGELGESTSSVTTQSPTQATTEVGTFTTSGRFNASPKSFWRALTEYESIANSSQAIGKVRRVWISSRVGKACLRLWSQDTSHLWGSMSTDVVVEIEANPEKGVIKFRTSDDGDDGVDEFSSLGEWKISPVRDSKFLCDVDLTIELTPTRFPVATSALRKWTSSQLNETVKQVTSRAIEIDQIRLRAPKFLPQLETDFGNISEFNGTRYEKESSASFKTKTETLTPAGYLGLSDVPLLDADSSIATGDSGTSTSQDGDTDDDTKSEKESNARTASLRNWFSDDDANLTKVGSSEVHMRRFDTDRFYHRRAIGAVRIEASPSAVFDLITDFDSAPEFIPDLAFTEIVSRGNTRGVDTLGASRTRVRHVFLKSKLFHVQQDAVTFDFIRRDLKNELQFTCVTSDASSDKVIQGKWLVVPVEGDTDAAILKFAIEARALQPSSSGRGVTQRNTLGFWQAANSFVSDEATNGPLSEKAVFTEILKMLTSVRSYSEQEAVTSSMNKNRSSKDDSDSFFLTQRLVPEALSKKYTDASGEQSKNSNSNVYDPLGSIRLALTDAGYGPSVSADGNSSGEFKMPPRSELRDQQLYTLEKEIVDLGGFEVVANKLGWTAKRRKPKGYWSSETNLKSEILAFIDDNALEQNVMPSRVAFEEKGRFDIARAVAKYGGAVALAQKLGLSEPKYRARRKSKASKK